MVQGEIEGICKDFGYMPVSRLWYTMPGMEHERANFHLVFDDDDAMYMTKLVKGHEEIHVYVEHPIDNPILVDEEDVSEGVQPLAVEQGPMGYYSDYSDDDDHDGVNFTVFMIVMTCMLMIKLVTMRMSQLRWMLNRCMLGE